MTARLHASMPARACLLGALLCLLLLGLAAVPAAHAARGMEIALEDEDVFVAGNYGDPATAYAAARELGVTRMRILVYWSNVMGSQARGRAVPGRVDYDFARIDDAIDAAAAAGIRVHLDLTGPAPAWATGNGRVGPDRPSPHHFGGFARDVARHFEGRVDRYSIWNEPNYPGWLRPARRAGQIYRRLYQEGYRAIKAEDPRAGVHCPRAGARSTCPGHSASRCAPRGCARCSTTCCTSLRARPSAPACWTSAGNPNGRTARWPPGRSAR